jgi:hypothetical protein
MAPIVALSTLLGAQDLVQPKTPATAPEAPRQAALSDVMSMTVRLQATTKAVNAATEAGTVAKQPSCSLTDIVIDGETGEASWAAVSIGGMLGLGDRVVAIPRYALVYTLTENDPVFDLRVTESELKSLPVFDPDAEKATGLNVSLLAAQKAWSKLRPNEWEATVEASSRAGDESTQTVEATDRKSAPRPILVSNLMGCKVRSSDDNAFGSIDQGCYNLDTHRVDYLIVGKGGLVGIGESHYVIGFPFARMTFVGEDRTPSIVLGKTTSQLAEAPRYHKPKTGVVSLEDSRQATEFYAIKRAEPQPESGSDSPRPKNRK